MENSSEGHESSTPEFAEGELEGTDASIKKESFSKRGSNSVIDEATDSYSSKKEELSFIKDVNLDEGRNTVSSVERSTLLHKTKLSKSLMSTASGSFSVQISGSKKGRPTNESLESKSKSSSMKTSSAQSSIAEVHTRSSEDSELSSPVYAPRPSLLLSLKQVQNEQRELFSKNLNLDADYKEGKTTPVQKSEIITSGSHYISPWAKSVSQMSCKPTLSPSSKEVKDDIRCIPPWAKTLRKFYGMTVPEPSEEPSQKNLQEKIKTLMDKHSRLMLVKRNESRKQVVVKPSESGDMGTLKMSSKNTRYYMTPIPREVQDSMLASDKKSITSGNDTSRNMSDGSDHMTVTKKTTRSQAKGEVSNVLKSLYNSKRQYKEEKKEKNGKKLKPKQQKCLKITPSNVRDFVEAQSLDPDGRKLHEIIKIKKVPSLGSQVGRQASSKYIINVPTCPTRGEGTTVNKITVKEKRKIRIDSVEDINENVTEIVYNEIGPGKKEKVKNSYTAEENIEHDVVPYSKKRKSPTKSRTLEVSKETTPIISDLVKKDLRDKDKILLIQYEEKTKPCKGESETEKPTLISTQLLGIKQPCEETLREMYLYGTERDGKKCKEKITQVDDVSPTLREKVNMIFQELKDMAFRPCAEQESREEMRSSVSSKTFQYPSTLVETDAVSVQALPEVRSAEVQVHDSVLLTQSPLGPTPHSTPTSHLSKEDQESITLELVDSVAEATKLEQKTTSSADSKQPGDIDEELKPDVELDVKMSKEIEETDTSHKSRPSTEEIVPLEDTKSPEGEEHSKETDELGDEGTKVQDEEEGEVIPLENKEEVMLEDETLKYNEAEEQDDAPGDDKKFDKEEEVPIHTITIEGDKDTKEDKETDETEGEKLEGKDEESTIESLKEFSDDLELSDQPKAGGIHVFTEDIRSYDFDPDQDYELRMISSSKFFHQRDSLRKLNWTEDILYLEQSTCPQLAKALAEIALRQPADPISYLAHLIYKDYHNRESDEQRSIYKEHLEVAKDSIRTKKDEKPICKQFNIRRYPMKRNTFSTIRSETDNGTEVTETEELKS